MIEPTREQIIRALKYWGNERRECINDCDKCPKEISDLCNIQFEPMCEAAYNIIAELEAENKRLKEERRWIPVSEKLPEDCTELKFYDDGILKATTVLAVVDGCVKMVNRLSVRKTGIAYIDESATNGWTWGRFTESGITHWQQLPQSPEESEGAI